MEAIKITVEHWSKSCHDGCCFDSGVRVKMGDRVIDNHGSDVGIVLVKALQMLGFKATLTENYTDDDSTTYYSEIINNE